MLQQIQRGAAEGLYDYWKAPTETYHVFNILKRKEKTFSAGEHIEKDLPRAFGGVLGCRENHLSRYC